MSPEARLGNNMLDTFSTIQPLAYAMLTYFAFSAIRLELSNLRVALSQATKMSLRTPVPLYTHRYVKVAMRLLWQ